MLSDEILQESSYYQKILNRGVQQGREEGREEGREVGREEGREVGRLDGERRLVRLLIAARFGMLPDSAEDKLRCASESDLERWATSLLQATSLEEVLN